MTAYVHSPHPHQPDKYASLLAEKARLEAETKLYETLTKQRQRLAEAKDSFHQNQTTPHTAEHIRQTAIRHNGDTPEICRQRLNEAAADADRWVDPRTTNRKKTR